MATRWNRPITVGTKRVGQYLTIQTVERAAEYMLQEWPKEPKGKAFDAARAALLAAHDGKLSPDDARAAFVKAIGEAEIFEFSA